LWGDAATEAWLESQLDALESGARTPFATAEALLERSSARLVQRASERSPG